MNNSLNCRFFACHIHIYTDKERLLDLKPLKHLVIEVTRKEGAVSEQGISTRDTTMFVHTAAPMCSLRQWGNTLDESHDV
jgi:hypothetical protein